MNKFNSVAFIIVLVVLVTGGVYLIPKNNQVPLTPGVNLPIGYSYSIENGSVYFNSVSPLPEDSVYNVHMRLSSADLKTFFVLKGSDRSTHPHLIYATDRNGVWVNGRFSRVADIATFKILTGGWSKDDLNVYAFSGERLVTFSIDPVSFIPFGSYYFADKGVVYFRSGVVKNNQPAFTIVTQGDAPSFQELFGLYAKDNGSVYVSGMKIPNADPKTFDFQELKEQYDRSSGTMDQFQTTQSNPVYVSNETKDWKIYRNEKYGLKFSFPKKWKFMEKTRDMVGGIDRDSYSLLDVVLTENGSERMIIRIFPKEYTSNGASRDAFKDGYARFSYFKGGASKETTIDGFKTLVKHVGCYECYEADPETIRKLDAQPISITCNSLDTCLQIQLIGLASEQTSLDDFFMNKFLPAVELLDVFRTNKIQYQTSEAAG